MSGPRASDSRQSRTACGRGIHGAQRPAAAQSLLILLLTATAFPLWRTTDSLICQSAMIELVTNSLEDPRVPRLSVLLAKAGSQFAKKGSGKSCTPLHTSACSACCSACCSAYCMLHTLCPHTFDQGLCMHCNWDQSAHVAGQACASPAALQ